MVSCCLLSLEQLCAVYICSQICWAIVALSNYWDLSRSLVKDCDGDFCWVRGRCQLLLHCSETCMLWLLWLPWKSSFGCCRDQRKREKSSTSRSSCGTFWLSLPMRVGLNESRQHFSMLCCTLSCFSSMYGLTSTSSTSSNFGNVKGGGRDFISNCNIAYSVLCLGQFLLSKKKVQVMPFGFI